MQEYFVKVGRVVLIFTVIPMKKALIRQSLSQLRSCYATPLRECLFYSPSVRRLRNDFVVTAPEVALQPVTQGRLRS